MKVLHVVENLDRGAVENWLVRMLRFGAAHRARLDWTFYCTLGETGQLDDEARALGARVIHSAVPMRQTLAFVHALRGELRRGRYDALHCHHDLTSAFYLVASTGLPIRVRLVHVHNADEGVPTPNRLKAALFRPLMRTLCLSAADRIVGISDHTLDTFLAGRRRRPGRDVVHYYGVDPEPFRSAVEGRLEFRRALGLADHTRILLVAGRMVPEKNPLFAANVFAELHRLDPDTAALFVGSGPLGDTVHRRVSELGLASAVRQLGWRNDVAAIMCCCDWFILPRPEHPMEGFGVAVVEAQLAGLCLLLSNAIPDDPLLPTARFRRLPLAAGARAWAVAAMELMNEGSPSSADAIAALAASPMDMERAFNDFVALHE